MYVCSLTLFLLWDACELGILTKCTARASKKNREFYMFTKQELSIYRILIRKDSYESIEIILKEEKLPLP